MPLDLPTDFMSAVRLLHAVHGSPDDRDTRIIHLALGHLEPVHREHFLSRAVDPNVLSELELAHRHDRAYHAHTRASYQALRVVFWKLGIITDPGPGHKRRAGRCLLTMGLMDRHLGSERTQTEFACLSCGALLRVPADTKLGFTCSNCGHRSRLSYHDGRRVAFPKPKPAPAPANPLHPPTVPAVDHGQVNLASPLCTFFIEAARLSELPPAPPSEAFTESYHALLAKYPATEPESSAAAMNEMARAVWERMEARCR